MTGYTQGMTRGRVATGFTIVELLIVIVVIAILAAITIVSYNGITLRAKESAAQTGAKEGFTKIATFAIDHGDLYPDTLTAAGLPEDGPTDYQYTVDNASTPRSFCLTASVSGISYQVSSTNSAPTKGACVGHTEGGSTTAPVATTMQTFTPTMCANLTTYTGTNEAAVITLTDSRGGTERSYQVAKLADGKCWMLNNLRLGSTTSAITLTPADSDVASDFTLPQVAVPSATSYDVPQAIGPVPGDSTTDPTKNYGYFYNFTAATAGETRTTLPATGGDAQHSICAKGWKLPTGAVAAGASDFSRLDQAFGGTGVFQSGAPAHLATGWLTAGAFKGVLFGNWSGSFYSQGLNGSFWSRSAYPGTVNYAFKLTFSHDSVLPGMDGNNRFGGCAIRCLLN